jgi:hypothetical protein
VKKQPLRTQKIKTLQSNTWWQLLQCITRPLNNKLSRIGNLSRVKLQQNGEKKKPHTNLYCYYSPINLGTILVGE